MECKCGAEIAGTTHEVKTIKMAKEWAEVATESDLPVTIESFECRSCGRFGFKMYSSSGELIFRRAV